MCNEKLLAEAWKYFFLKKLVVESDWIYQWGKRSYTFIRFCSPWIAFSITTPFPQTKLLLTSWYFLSFLPVQGNEDVKTQDLKILSLEIKIKMLKLKLKANASLQIPIITWTDYVCKKEVLKKSYSRKILIFLDI